MHARHRIPVLAAFAWAALAACSDPSGGGPSADATPRDAASEASTRGDGAMADGGAGDASMADAAPQDASSMDASPSDASGGDGSLIEQLLCPPASQVGDEIVSLTNGEGAAGLCDGLDNDYDGRIDDGCPCTPGETQRCFAGPPGHDGVGACARGIQVCEGFEFPGWGDCVGGTVPSDEQCDGLDNDCNGCTDELEKCTDVVDCPLPGDPRIGTAAPFSTHTFDADQFVNPALVQSYQWHVEGTPCDRMFRTLPGGANEFNGRLSYTLTGAKSAKPQLDLTLSGEYAVSLDVTLVNGETVSCDFPLVVGAPGLRVELCWPESGPNSPGGKEVDLDLHLGQQGQTVDWNDAKDCFYDNDGCDIFSAGSTGLWGAAPSAASECSGAVPENVRQYVTACPNPRLDIDSYNTLTARGGTKFPTENINMNRVANGGTYRVAVVNGDCSGTPSCTGRVAHPLVNVYCDRKLAGSFRLPNGAEDPSFGAGNSGELDHGPRDVWRVVDVLTHKSNGAVDCELTPITDDAGTGPRIEPGPDAGTLPY